MQLSLYADYSCRTLMYLALKDSEEKSSIEEIANAYRISSNHLVKVVHKLGQLGYIETSRGRNGGIRLARPPRDIRIGEVIRRTEPTLDLVECFDSSKNTCVANAACGLKPWLRKAMTAFFAVLDGVTLEDVVSDKKGLYRQLGLDFKKPVVLQE